MAIEGTEFDKKSLRVVHPQLDGKAVAADCVAFANARGGRIVYGIEDGEEMPSEGQSIPDRLVELVRKRIPQITMNVSVDVGKIPYPNQSEALQVRVLRSSGIASTSDGRYFIRVGDESKPLMPDELQRLLNEKGAYRWESELSPHDSRDVDPRLHGDFLRCIRTSDRVSKFVKGKSDAETLDYYILTREGRLTNLGVLWIGRREQRAVLGHAPVIQFIKYDETGEKVNKINWDDFSLTPMELIESVWTTIPDWRESYEFPDGLFRKLVPHFDEVVVRELLANALVHRPYTMSGDIFIKLYPDRLEIHNPGLLPLGVSPSNILHTSIKRNELLAKVFYDLKLMEREGSGFDRIYEALLASGRPTPKVVEGNDRVAVTIQRRILKREVLDFMVRADQVFGLTQKEKIALGLLVQHESLTLQELRRLLMLESADGARSWLGRLVNRKVVLLVGRTKAARYLVDPELLRKLDFQGRTTLKRIEPYRLRELILTDLKIYKKASISEIHQRIGLEIGRKNLQKALVELLAEKKLQAVGEFRWRRYLLEK